MTNDDDDAAAEEEELERLEDDNAACREAFLVETCLAKFNPRLASCNDLAVRLRNPRFL